MKGKRLHRREKSVMKGVYTFTKAILETPAQFALEARIRKERDMGKDVYELVRQLNSMCKTEVTVVENIIPTAGRAAIANALTDVTPSPSALVITHMALGSGTNVPANGDVALQTEVYRNAIASNTNASNVAYATGFFSTTETSGTYREVGLFIASTTMLSRSAINITKSAVETLTIDYTITII